MSRRRENRDDELDEEIRSHLRMAIEERVARGEPRVDAEVAARRELGNIAHIKEVTRGAWGWLWLDHLVQDLRFAVRSLRHSPAFTAIAVLTMALGIGSTVAVFTVVHGVLMRPLPFAHPDRLMALSHGPVDRSHISDREFVELQRTPSSFSGVATFSNLPVTLTGNGDPIRLNAGTVTTDFLGVLGVSPALGADFGVSSDAVMLGDALWRARFGGDPTLIGKRVTLDGVPRTVVGIMPAGFDFPNRAELWTPLEVKVEANQSLARPAIGRLRDDVTLDQARAAFAALMSRLEPTDPDPHAARNARVASVTPLRAVIVGDARRPLLIFAGAVALVLLIACTNVTNLLLMRAGTRQRELAVRAALGASRNRLVRQLLTESAAIAMLGGIAGVLLAMIGVRAFVALAPAGTLPRLDAIGMNLTVLTFALTISMVTGIGFGVAPAFQATRRNVRDDIAEGARTHSPSRGRARNLLVITEMALALVLLTGAGLLVRSFQQLRSIDLGFQPSSILTVTVELPMARYRDVRAMHDVHARVLDGLARIPAVEAAGAVNWRPLGSMHISGDFRLGDGRPVPEGYQPFKLAVSPGYFAAMGIPLRRGRTFDAHDDTDGAGVLIISRSVAERFWPNGDPLGQRISLRDNPKPGEWLTIVGIVDDVVQSGVTHGAAPALYQPLEQVTHPSFLGHMNFVVRSEAAPDLVAPAMRAAIREADPNLPVQTIATMDRVILSSIGDRLFQTRLLAFFSVLALILAAVGIYGVTAYAVTERRHEIGVRMALGARAGTVMRMVLRRTVALVVPGVVIGALCALAATRVLSNLLFGVGATDPATFVSVTLLLAGVAIAATVGPARRAARVNPVDALKG